MRQPKIKSTMEKPDKNDDAILLRLPAHLKEALQRRAMNNGRRITSEINTRLQKSLDAEVIQTNLGPQTFTHPLTTSYKPQPDQTQAVIARDSGSAQSLSDLDRAMLKVFHSLPPEKQLALLSLFK